MKRVNVLGSGIAAAMVLGAMSITAPVSAGDVLWDQPLILDSTAFVDQNFPDFPDFSTFLVSDVVFGSGVIINSITTYYTNANNLWPQNAAGTATLNIFADPLSGGDDPMAGASVVVNFVTSADGIAVTASGLNIALGAGTYWIGLSPELDFGAAGQEFHLEAAGVGANTQGRNPGGGFGLGLDWFDAGQTFAGINWDGAITIIGVPAPGAMALLGIAGLAGTRRRRRK